MVVFKLSRSGYDTGVRCAVKCKCGVFERILEGKKLEEIVKIVNKKRHCSFNLYGDYSAQIFTVESSPPVARYRSM